MKLTRVETPLDNDLIDELICFWEEIFGYNYNRRILEGDEVRYNRNLIYIARDKTKIVGTCNLTLPCHATTVGGLGEVATSSEYRARGIASTLCKNALADFSSLGGHALFLGTENPKAEKVYGRLGWQRINGSQVWVNLIGCGSVDDFYEDYFKADSSIRIVEGSASQRIPLIPLIVFPHRLKMLDSNTCMFSTTHTIQKSCMRLYPYYRNHEENPNSIWLCAVNEADSLVGLSTIVKKEGNYIVDGFAHPSYWHMLPALITEPCSLVEQNNKEKIRAFATKEDTDKLSVFMQLGFKKVCGTDENGLQLIVLER